MQYFILSVKYWILLKSFRILSTVKVTLLRNLFYWKFIKNSLYLLKLSIYLRYIVFTRVLI